MLKANGEQPFESQYIPINPDHLAAENYKIYLAQHRQLIAARLN